MQKYFINAKIIATYHLEHKNPSWYVKKLRINLIIQQDEFYLQIHLLVEASAPYSIAQHQFFQFLATWKEKNLWI